jgi:hypothetical protein
LRFVPGVRRLRFGIWASLNRLPLGQFLLEKGIILFGNGHKKKKKRTSTPVVWQTVSSGNNDSKKVLLLRIWGWRYELGTAICLGIIAWLSHYLISILLVVFCLGLYQWFSEWRPVMRRPFHNARVRRHWNAGMRATELNKHGRSPRIVRIHPTEIGDDLKVKLPGGMSVATIIEKQKALTAWLEAMDITIERDRHNARYCHVSVIFRDLLSTMGKIPWPLRDSLQFSIWDDIPVALDRKGGLVTINLIERHFLIGGETGGGKSVMAAIPVACAALDPSVGLVLLDGTEVDMGMWEDCAQVFVGADPEYASAILACIQEEINRRISWMRTQRPKRRKIQRGDPWPVYVIATDELAFYMQYETLQRQLQDIIQRGRKVGIIIIGAVQKPSEKVMPTAIRDMFSYKCAFRCATHDASDCILGRGSHSEGYSAFDISPEDRGVAWLRAGPKPIKIKAFFLEDEEIDALAERATTLRQNSAPLRSIQFPPPSTVLKPAEVKKIEPAQTQLFEASSDDQT